MPFPCVVVVWESSKDTDLVAFAQAAAALGHHAMENPQATRRRLGRGGRLLLTAMAEVQELRFMGE